MKLIVFYCLIVALSISELGLAYKQGALTPGETGVHTTAHRLQHDDGSSSATGGGNGVTNSGSNPPTLPGLQQILDYQRVMFIRFQMIQQAMGQFITQLGTLLQDDRPFKPSDIVIRPVFIVGP